MVPDMTDRSEFRPVSKLHNTANFNGFKTESPAVNNGEVKALPVTQNSESIDSVWKLDSVWERVKFLFKGEVTLRVLGQRLPGVVVVNGDIYEN